MFGGNAQGLAFFWSQPSQDRRTKGRWSRTWPSARGTLFTNLRPSAKDSVFTKVVENLEILEILESTQSVETTENPNVL